MFFNNGKMFDVGTVERTEVGERKKITIKGHYMIFIDIKGKI